VPCGQCLCISCKERVNDCPMCRRAFNSTVRIYLDAVQPEVCLNDFVKLERSHVEFLQACCPEASANPTNIGIALAPLLKVACLSEQYPGVVKVVIKFLVPSLVPNKEVRQLLLGELPISMVTYFGKQMNSRMAVIRAYGVSSIVLEESVYVDAVEALPEDVELRDWLIRATGCFPGIGYLCGGESKEEGERKDRVIDLLEEQHRILTSMAGPGNVATALENLQKCYPDILGTGVQSSNSSESSSTLNSETSQRLASAFFPPSFSRDGTIMDPSQWRWSDEVWL
jgi:hypothetical protein